MQLLVGWSTLQQASYICIFLLSFRLQYILIINVMIFAMGAIVFLNILSIAVFKYETKKDLTYQHWSA